MNIFDWSAKKILISCCQNSHIFGHVEKDLMWIFETSWIPIWEIRFEIVGFGILGFLNDFSVGSTTRIIFNKRFCMSWILILSFQTNTCVTYCGAAAFSASEAPFPTQTKTLLKQSKMHTSIGIKSVCSNEPKISSQRIEPPSSETAYNTGGRKLKCFNPGDSSVCAQFEKYSLK